MGLYTWQGDLLAKDSVLYPGQLGLTEDPQCCCPLPQVCTVCGVTVYINDVTWKVTLSGVGEIPDPDLVDCKTCSELNTTYIQQGEIGEIGCTVDIGDQQDIACDEYHPGGVYFYMERFGLYPVNPGGGAPCQIWLEVTGTLNGNHTGFPILRSIKWQGLVIEDPPDPYNFAGGTADFVGTEPAGTLYCAFVDSSVSVHT